MKYLWNSCLILGCLMVAFISCKKKQLKKNITISGQIFQNCQDIAANTNFYFVFDTGYGYDRPAPILFKTDANGYFHYETNDYTKDFMSISTDTNPYHVFFSFYTAEEDINVNSIYVKQSNELIIKLKTSSNLVSLDSLKYVFQYASTIYSVSGNITKDTIVGQHIINLNSPNPKSGFEDKLLWWSLNKSTVGSNDNQVNFKIHGCVGTADTAYIVIP